MTKDKLYQWKLTNSEICEECGVREDANHVLFACTKYLGNRYKHKCLITYSNTEDLLKNTNTKTYREIANFIKINRIQL